MASKARALPDMQRKRKTLNRREATLRRKTTRIMAGTSIAPKRKKFKCLRPKERREVRRGEKKEGVRHVKAGSEGSAGREGRAGQRVKERKMKESVVILQVLTIQANLF